MPEPRRKNQRAVQAANKQVNRLAEVFEFLDSTPSAYTCECASAGCFAPIALTPGEYEAARTRSDGYLVAPGHVGDGERVAKRAPGFWVVEKVEAADAAG